MLLFCYKWSLQKKFHSLFTIKWITNHIFKNHPFIKTQINCGGKKLSTLSSRFPPNLFSKLLGSTSLKRSFVISSPQITNFKTVKGSTTFFTIFHTNLIVHWALTTCSLYKRPLKYYCRGFVMACIKLLGISVTPTPFISTIEIQFST